MIMTTLNYFGFRPQTQKCLETSEIYVHFPQSANLQICFLDCIRCKRTRFRQSSEACPNTWVISKIHGNKGRKDPNAFNFKFDEILNIVQYLQSYATQNSIPQPAGPRGGGQKPQVYLPCSGAKEAIHKQYKEDCGLTGPLSLVENGSVQNLHLSVKIYLIYPIMVHVFTWA